MKRTLYNLSSALSLNRARTSAASYRIVGKPGHAGSLLMTRLGESVTPWWHPTLLDSLRAPLTRRHE